MHRRSFIASSVALLTTSGRAGSGPAQNVRFGILRLAANDQYELDQETRRIPKKLKDTGFRFGISFENPSCQQIEWYEVVHLPADVTQATGNMRRDAQRALKTDSQTSDQPAVVDDFWFDDGDPLGRHRLDLFVNGALAYSVEFEVLKS